MKLVQYVTFFDDAKTIGGDQLSDLHFPFDAPGADPESRSILLFKMNPIGQATQLRIRLNNNPHFVEKQFLPTQIGDFRSFHELVNKGFLKAQNNELVVSVSSGGKVVVSDFVLMYKENVA